MYYMKRSLLLGLASVLLSLASTCGFPIENHPRGPVIETAETYYKAYKVRVTSYEEKGASVEGALYVFESQVTGANDWREILAFRHDDRVKIPTNQIRAVNDRIGYLFMGWTYAVTTDSGTTWSTWNAAKDLPNWQCCNYALIRDVQLAPSGAGTMILNPIPQRQGEVQELRTSDYGRHWN